ncbi:MAG: choice-of-anchor U domain-containing protein, partial [Thermodesulfobacteriota bacterium]
VGPPANYTFENVIGDHTLVVKFGSETLWDDVPGIYAGELAGDLTIPGSFMVKNAVIPFAPAIQGTWVFDLAEDGSALITLSGGPPIFLFGDISPVFDDIIGTGMVDTQTGAARMMFTVPLFGEFEGTGQFTCDNQFTFEIPDLGYTLSGILNQDGTVAGLWAFDSSLCFVSFNAGGTFDGSLVALPTDSFITATIKGAGTIEPSGVVAVAAGADQTFTFTPADGCEVLEVIVDGDETIEGPLANYTFETVGENHTIEVKFGSAGLWATIPGTYAGGFDGEVSDPLLLPAEGTWSVVVDEDANILVTVQGPSIMGTFGTITGEGTVDPETGAADLVFQIPVLGEAPGTAQFDCAGGFSFEVPDFGFSMSGQVAEDRSISGTWDLDATMVFFKIAASGDLTESAKYTQPQTIEITAVGPGRVLPFGTNNETETVRVERGESPELSFEVYAEGGCEVLDVIVDDESKGAVDSYTFSSIAADHTVTVLFGSAAMWTGVAGAYTGGMEGDVSYRILGSAAQQESVDGSWQFDVSEDGQLEILVQGLPVIGDIVGTGRVADLRTGYAPIDFSIPGLDGLMAGFGGLVPSSLAGYGQFYCDRTFEFYMSYFGVTMTMEGVLGDGGWAFGTWEVGSESLFVALDGQGAFSTDIDQDGLPDGWEVEYGLDPTDPADAEDDSDNDGLTSLEEYALGTSPVDNDTDGDGLTDGQEADGGTNPLVVTAGPGIPDPTSPADGALLVSLTPTLAVDYRDGFDGTLHVASVWQVATDEAFSALVFEADSDTALLEIGLPETMLEPGTAYFWRARFVDADGNQRLWCDPVAFTTDPAPFADANGNDIPDGQEVTASTDLDGNGVNDANQDEMARVLSSDGDSQLGLTTGNSGQTIAAVSVVDPADVPEDVELPFGLVGFRVVVADPGDTAEVTIFFSDALDEDAAWYKYDAVNGWWDFSGNAQFAGNMKSVTLTLTDGGAGDADGVANGVI